MSFREIYVNNKIWKFRIGKGSAVIRSPDKGPSYIVDLSTLTGRFSGVIERGRWKRTQDGQVTPKHIKEWIDNHLLSKK